MTVRRKYCSLHGWAPHVKTAHNLMLCCRCGGVRGRSKSANIKAFFRGFKIPESISAKIFLRDRF